MIKIDGITEEQKRLLNAMWKMDTKEEMEEWVNTLSLRQKKMIPVLKELMIASYLDTIMNEHQVSEANQEIKRIKKGF